MTPKEPKSKCCNAEYTIASSGFPLFGAKICKQCGNTDRAKPPEDQSAMVERWTCNCDRSFDQKCTCCVHFTDPNCKPSSEVKDKELLENWERKFDEDFSTKSGYLGTGITKSSEVKKIIQKLLKIARSEAKREENKEAIDTIKKIRDERDKLQKELQIADKRWQIAERKLMELSENP